MLGVSRSLVMYTVLSIITILHHSSGQLPLPVILNSSLSSPGPGRGTTLRSERVFTPFLTAALWLQRLLLVTVFCIPNGGSLNIRPGYHRPAPPGSGQYDLM